MLRDLLFELSLPERSCSIKHWKQSGEVRLDCSYFVFVLFCMKKA